MGMSSLRRGDEFSPIDTSNEKRYPALSNLQPLDPATRSSNIIRLIVQRIVTFSQAHDGSVHAEPF